MIFSKMIYRSETSPGLSKPFLPLLLLLALGSLWGLSPAFTKFLALEGISPIGAVFWQTLIAGTGLLIIILIRRVKVKFDRRYVSYFAVMGAVGIALPNSNMVFVVEHIPAGLMSVIIVTAPVITYIVAVVIRLEKLDACRAAGVLLGLIGVAVLVLPRGSLPSADMLPFALLAFITPTAWALTNVYAEAARPVEADSMVLAMGTMFSASITALVASIATNTFHPIWLDFDVGDQALIAYGLITVCTFFLYFTVVSMSGAVYLAQVGYITTLMGLGWGAWFYGEEPSAWLWIAVVLVFAGLMLVNFGKRRNKT
jgi:drug/metabolite transporter (DMT)-like permease|tara:strand:+ start:406 stop:1344 length:939 start_codon:yes stop_codon:yes gene_type:complete